MFNWKRTHSLYTLGLLNTYILEDGRRILGHRQIRLPGRRLFAARRQHVHVLAGVVVALQRVALDQTGRLVDGHPAGTLFGHAVTFAAAAYKQNYKPSQR